MLGEEERPQHDEVTYIIEAAAQVEQSEEEKKGAAEDTPKKSDAVSVIFCIDISGSMRGSRLNAAKNALVSQINSMAEKNGDRKLGIVAFDNVVDVYGDGVEKMVTINNDDNALNEFEKL